MVHVYSRRAITNNAVTSFNLETEVKFMEKCENMTIKNAFDELKHQMESCSIFVSSVEQHKSC